MVGAGIATGLLVALLLGWRPIGGAPSEPVAPPTRPVTTAPPRASTTVRREVVNPVDTPAPEPSAPEDDLWSRRLIRAQETLSAYRASTRYPPGARPIAEHPDQVRPHFVAPVSLPLARADGKLTTTRVTLRQDRMFLVGDERAALAIACNDGESPVACGVASASATVPPDAKNATSPRATSVTFTEAEGGGLATMFQPSAQGFAGYRGPIRIELALDVAGESGGAAFDLVYSPAPPAVFTGQVDEALREGSLDLDVAIVINEEGRYVITARVDDADGRSFAYLSDNTLRPIGRQAVRLRLFGKLIRDEGARSPFRLRDLEGFKLLEDVYPDRDPMLGREGVVHTTKSYALRDFADAEWESDEKSRHVKELTKDVDEASAHAGGR